MRSLVSSFVALLMFAATACAQMPPLFVEEVDGTPSGVTLKIKVSNGTLTQSGTTMTIDTTGTASSIAGSDKEVQYNDSGTLFDAEAGFEYDEDTNALTVAGYTLPTSDGSANELMQTNGSGTLSFVDWTPLAYHEFILLPGGAILDDNFPPELTIIESTGNGTPRFRVAAFDPTADEVIYWTLAVPTDVDTTADWLADVYWFTNDVGANEDAIWAMAVSATTEADTADVEEQAIAPVINSGNVPTAAENCNVTEADRLIVTTITLPVEYIDGATASDLITLRFYRDADDSEGNADNDGLTSDAELIHVRLRIPRDYQ